MRILPVIAFVLASFPIHSQPVTPIRLTLTQRAIDPATPTILALATIENTGNVVLGQIAITLHSLDGGELSIPDPAWTCTGSGTGYLQCLRRAPFAAQSTLDVEYRMHFPYGAGRARVRAYVEWSATEFGGRVYGDQQETVLTLFRRFTVTSTADAGEGTLRNAILALNADFACAVGPCKIDFAIPDIAPGSWATITPLTPLPSIVGPYVEVDATTQPDTNPRGPDVALLGTIHSGDALDIRSIPYTGENHYPPQMAVRGFAIGGFPGNGIYHVPHERGSGFVIEKNYIGTDPTGSFAIVNLGRGIMIGEGMVTGVFVSQGFFDPAEIRDNVLSGNYRSGVYALMADNPFLPGNPVLAVRRNRIGVAAASDMPIPNGASGIFIGPHAIQTLIEDNVIAHNAHFGVAVADGAKYTRFGANRIFGHPLPAIDRGLNGAANPRFQPRLESATYNAATDTTTIVAQSPWEGGFIPYEFLFYANANVGADGFAETEQFLGKATPDIDSGRATFTFQGDLRGKYVTATATYAYWDFSPFFESSEITPAWLVE